MLAGTVILNIWARHCMGYDIWLCTYGHIIAWRLWRKVLLLFYKWMFLVYTINRNIFSPSSFIFFQVTLNISKYQFYWNSLWGLQIEKKWILSDILPWTPSHGQASVGWPAKTYLQQLWVDKGCNLEDLPDAMDDRDGKRERVRGNPCEQ